MADDQSSYKVAITTAIIGLIGVLGTAVISNWDKLVSSSHGPGRRIPVRLSPTPHRMGQLLLKTNLQSNDLSPIQFLSQGRKIAPISAKSATTVSR
jgi:hypothetical protein